jgi:hypothetical protein
LNRSRKEMMEESPGICPPVGSPEEQDADRRFEDAVKVRLRRCAASGSSQGLLDDKAAEAVDDEENWSASFLWSASQSFERA